MCITEISIASAVRHLTSSLADFQIIFESPNNQSHALFDTSNAKQIIDQLQLVKMNDDTSLNYSDKYDDMELSSDWSRTLEGSNEILKDDVFAYVKRKEAMPINLSGGFSVIFTVPLEHTKAVPERRGGCRAAPRMRVHFGPATTLVVLGRSTRLSTVSLLFHLVDGNKELLRFTWWLHFKDDHEFMIRFRFKEIVVNVSQM